MLFNKIHIKIKIKNKEKFISSFVFNMVHL